MQGYCVEIGVQFGTITCCHDGCGITFAVPKTWIKDRRDDHGRLYCPNGHGMSYYEKSDEEKLREQLKRQERITESVANQRDSERRTRKRTERQLAAQKGVVTKIKKRVAFGVCPCCSRTFKQLRRHIQNKHPEFSLEK